MLNLKNKLIITDNVNKVYKEKFLSENRNGFIFGKTMSSIQSFNKFVNDETALFWNNIKNGIYSDKDYRFSIRPVFAGRNDAIRLLESEVEDERIENDDFGKLKMSSKLIATAIYNRIMLMVSDGYIMDSVFLINGEDDEKLYELCLEKDTDMKIGLFRSAVKCYKRYFEKLISNGVIDNIAARYIYFRFLVNDSEYIENIRKRFSDIVFEFSDNPVNPELFRRFEGAVPVTIVENSVATGSDIENSAVKNRFTLYSDMCGFVKEYLQKRDELEKKCILIVPHSDNILKNELDSIKMEAGIGFKGMYANGINEKNIISYIVFLGHLFDSAYSLTEREKDLFIEHYCNSFCENGGFVEYLKILEKSARNGLLDVSDIMESISEKRNIDFKEMIEHPEEISQLFIEDIKLDPEDVNYMKNMEHVKKLGRFTQRVADVKELSDHLKFINVMDFIRDFSILEENAGFLEYNVEVVPVSAINRVELDGEVIVFDYTNNFYRKKDIDIFGSLNEFDFRKSKRDILIQKLIDEKNSISNLVFLTSTYSVDGYEQKMH